MDWAVAVVAFGSMAALLAISFLMWTGRWRSWYRPSSPFGPLPGLGPSPLLVPALLGGVLGMVGLILLSSAVHLHVLVDVGIAAGVGGIVVAGWIGLGNPSWAMPKWMQQQEQRK